MNSLAHARIGLAAASDLNARHRSLAAAKVERSGSLQHERAAEFSAATPMTRRAMCCVSKIKAAVRCGMPAATTREQMTLRVPT